MSKKPASKSQSKPTESASKASGTGSSNQPAMKTSEIRDLIDFISKSGLNEVNVETKELKLHVKREPDQKIFKSTPVPTAAAPTVAPAATTQTPKAEKTAPVESGKKTVEIKSPMIG